MPRIEKTDGGVYVYDASPIPDGTFIPYDYNASKDSTTPPQIKEMVVRILDYVAQQDTQSYSRSSYNEPTGAPSGAPRASSQNFEAMEDMDNRAMRLLTKKWGWMERQVNSDAVPATLRSRAQKYITSSKKKPKTTNKKIKTSNKKRPASKRTTRKVVRKS
jgi:hypothetical protein